jgi:HEAT repeat protein
MRDQGVDIDKALRGLRDPNAPVRENAARALGEVADTRALEPLLEALSDESEDVREEAARALGALGDRRAVPALIDTLRGDWYLARLTAVSALGAIASEDAVLALRDTLHDPVSAVRAVAATALATTKNPHAADWLASAAEDESDEPTRCVMALALAELSDHRAVSLLLDLLRSGISPSRESAAHALSRFPSSEVKQALEDAGGDQHLTVRQAAARALERLGTPRA